MSMFKNSTSTNPPLESTLISVNSPQPLLENTPLKPTPSSPVTDPPRTQGFLGVYIGVYQP